MCKIVAVPTVNVCLFWELAERHIAEALKHSNGECDIEKIKIETFHGSRQLWLVIVNEKISAAASTRVIHYHNFFSVMVDFLSGEKMDSWLKELEIEIALWAKSIGAKRVELIGRKGFEKALTPYGFKTSYYYLTKEV